MNPPELNQIISLSIHNIGSSGEGIGSIDGYTVFVEGALPGETVKASITEQHKRYSRAQLISIETPSLHRATPPCPLFGTCGGCQLMHLSYDQQLETKRQRVVDAMQRIGKIDNAPVANCLASPSPLAYRNKIQLPTRQTPQGIAIGLYARGSHDLVELNHCEIHCPLGEIAFKEAKAVIKESQMIAYDPATGQGELRHILIKSAVKTEEVLIILVTNREHTPLLSQIAKKIMARCSFVKGVIHNLNQGRDNVILGNRYTTLEGTNSITESLSGLRFKVSPASFFQVNPAQAERLYATALTLANLTGKETVLDAYCGVGTLALLFAKHAQRVIGVECVREAITDATFNAQLNSIQNVSFTCADAETFIHTLSSIDLAILNPPRQGCSPGFLKGIKKLSPKTIIYVSCDPATLARDLAILCHAGYQITMIQPVDMFPQTAHVESVVHLRCGP